LVATVGFNISVFTHLKFGWDTEGFYWSTLDTNGQESPAFGVSTTFSAGVALNFGLIEAGIQAWFRLDLGFNWNNVSARIDNPNSSLYGKIRGSQIDYLASLPLAAERMGHLFDVTLTGTVGVTFYVDLTVPVPWVGPITKRIKSHTFSQELFSTTFEAVKPGIVLATTSVAAGGSGIILDLNMGVRADQRLFHHTQAKNELFTIELIGPSASGIGESVRIRANLGDESFEEVYHDVTLIRGSAGSGTSMINAETLETTVVEFTGGSGRSLLVASQAQGNILRGGRGTSVLRGSKTASNQLVEGYGNTVIYGGTAQDTITSGVSSDILHGGGGGDVYRFLDNYGRDQLVVTGGNNVVDFSSASDGVNFSLGRLVQSAKSDSNTIFFAPDAGGTNSIDTWIGSQGDDRFDTYHFAPDSSLFLEGRGGADFYSITLGNPSKRYVRDADPSASTLIGKMDPSNLGYININDSSSDGHVLIKQTYAEQIEYDRFHISNGREQVSMTGIETVDLDAGDATVVWGNLGTEWVDLGVNSTVTAGTIEMLSNVEAEGLNLNLKRGFSLTQALNLRNNSDLNLTIQNVDPLASANLFLGTSGAS
ncbi:MAG: hypothetical protein AAF226_13975, partial [Verrucomicrobiota bacterium]